MSKYTIEVFSLADVKPVIGEAVFIEVQPGTWEAARYIEHENKKSVYEYNCADNHVFELNGLDDWECTRLKKNPERWFRIPESLAAKPK